MEKLKTKTSIKTELDNIYYTVTNHKNHNHEIKLDYFIIRALGAYFNNNYLSLFKLTELEVNNNLNKFNINKVITPTVYDVYLYLMSIDIKRDFKNISFKTLIKYIMDNYLDSPILKQNICYEVTASDVIEYKNGERCKYTIDEIREELYEIASRVKEDIDYNSLYKFFSILHNRLNTMLNDMPIYVPNYGWYTDNIVYMLDKNSYIDVFDVIIPKIPIKFREIIDIDNLYNIYQLESFIKTFDLTI